MESHSSGFIIIIICFIFIALLSVRKWRSFLVNRIRLRHLIEKGSTDAKIAQKIRDQHDRLFGAVVLSGTLFTVLASSIGTAMAIDFSGKDKGIILATVVMTIVTVVFG